MYGARYWRHDKSNAIWMLPGINPIERLSKGRKINGSIRQ